MEKLGLIAGSGCLPLIFAREAKAEVDMAAVAISGFTSSEVENLIQKTIWVKIGEFDRAVKFLLSEGARQAVMIGKVPQSVLLNQTGFNGRITSILEKLGSKQTESILKALADELEKEGIELIDGRKYLSSCLAGQGVLSERQPNGREIRDIEFGEKIVKEIGRLDIGQTVVIKNGVILAIEAIEGTDSAIRRGAEWGGEGAVVVKMSKPQQDMRFDIPVVGRGTIELLREVKASALAIEAERTVILDREELIQIADEAKICVVAL
ncbi:UDP-2,3-diacylglucosamine diphosphatase LpxI [candidate division NPL-UPA2 bacterium]|nr:UDP-2,3-diacylglucosamine diphosphatase LpxI [candidate division NPL-UPA2 bacterium]